MCGRARRVTQASGEAFGYLNCITGRGLAIIGQYVYLHTQAHIDVCILSEKE